MGTENNVEPKDMNIEEIAKSTIEAAFTVYKNLGPGLLESVYEYCLVHELKKRGFSVQTQLALPVYYDGELIDAGYRIDMLIEDRLIVELKTVEKILPVHKAQLLTYVKLSRKKLGLLMNFNSAVFKEGIKRVIN